MYQLYAPNYCPAGLDPQKLSDKSPHCYINDAPSVASLDSSNGKPNCAQINNNEYGGLVSGVCSYLLGSIIGMCGARPHNQEKMS